MFEDSTDAIYRDQKSTSLYVPITEVLRVIWCVLVLALVFVRVEKIITTAKIDSSR